MRKSGVAMLALLPGVLLSSPAFALDYKDVLKAFEDHCSLRTLSCSLSKTKSTDLPDTHVPPSATVSMGPFVTTGKCGVGFFDENCNIDLTRPFFMGGSNPGYWVDGGKKLTCVTKTGTLHLWPSLSVSVSVTTKDGACS